MRGTYFPDQEAQKPGDGQARSWYEDVADRHAAADLGAGHEWRCQCLGCREARKFSYAPRLKRPVPKKAKVGRKAAAAPVTHLQVSVAEREQLRSVVHRLQKFQAQVEAIPPGETWLQEEFALRVTYNGFQWHNLVFTPAEWRIVQKQVAAYLAKAKSQRRKHHAEKET